jgi:hypothetical protein
VPHEILAELAPYFAIEARSYFPLPFLPLVATNLVIGFSLRPHPVPAHGGS